MLKSGDMFGKDKQGSFRTGRIDNRVHFMMLQLGTIIDRGGAHINTQAHQISAGKPFRNRLATRATRTMNKIRRRGGEVEAIDVIVEGSGTDMHLIMLTFSNLNSSARRHFRVEDKRAQKINQRVTGGNLEIGATRGKSKSGGLLSAIGRAGRELPELRIYMNDMPPL